MLVPAFNPNVIINNKTINDDTINNVLFNDTTTKDIATIYDPINRKIIVAYCGYNNNSKGYGFVMVGTVINKDNTIKFGNKIVFNEGITKNIYMAYDSVKRKLVIAFADGNNSDYGTVIVGTVFGNTIDFSDKVVFNNNSTGYITMIYNVIYENVIIAFTDKKSKCSMVTMGTINNDIIEFNNPVMFNSSPIYNASMIYEAYNGKLIIAYADTNNLNYGVLKTGRIIDDRIKFNNPIIFNNNYTDYINMNYDYVNKEIFITFSSKYPLLEGVTMIAKIINNDIVFGDKIVFNDESTRFVSTVYAHNKHKLIIAYCNDNKRNSPQSVITVGTVTGYNIKISKPVVFANNYCDNISATYDSFNRKIVIGYSDYEKDNCKFNGKTAIININNIIAQINANNVAT